MISLILVDRVGRRSLLLAGSVLMAISLLALTIFAGYQYSASGYHQRETCSHGANYTEHLHKNPFSEKEHVTKSEVELCESEEMLPRGIQYIAFCALVVYVTAFSFSFGPVTWILLTEIFPVSLKGDAMSLAQAVNWTTNVFVSVTFLDAVRVFTLPLVFSVHLLFALLAIFFIYFAVPETKGKSLEEISKDMCGIKTSKPMCMTSQFRKPEETTEFNLVSNSSTEF